ncbi:MAG TPA: hypothetical protein VJX23_07790 [Candidatus Binataceae bacterium]|nr:hypothetical protein [Candidatus Binataceae bacterium]
MKTRQAVVGIVWLGFAALIVWVFLHDGRDAFTLPFDSLTNTAGTIDLIIELTLVSLWMYFDARKRGTSAIPFIVIAVVFGSLGPLAYLFLRFRDTGAEPIV